MRHIFSEILHEELISALGCTEPIAVAYATAKAREVLGCIPDSILMQCSGNIIKNVQGVVVPTTGNLKGVDTAAVLGAIGGDPSKALEVLTSVQPEDIATTKELLAKKICKVEHLKGVENLYIKAILTGGGHTVSVTIEDTHINIVEIIKDGEILSEKLKEDKALGHCVDRSSLSVKAIYDYAKSVDLSEISDVLENQLSCNMAIAKEGLKNSYGANVGRNLLKHYGNDVKTRARALAAAGSDARMSGSVLPVVVNSGSGNQGMTVAIPIAVYAEELKSSKEELLRALAFANLLSIYQKEGIGKLSAYCGAVSAGCATGAGIAFLHNEPFSVIEKTICNVLGNVAGIICDGAKPSCAAKIASSVDAALLGYHMAVDDNSFKSGEGIIKDDIDKTVHGIWRLGHEGMRETDIEVLKIMIEK